MGNVDVQITLADGGEATAGSKLKGYVVLTVIKGGIKAVSLDINFWGREWTEVEHEEEDYSDTHNFVGLQQNPTSRSSLIDTTIAAGDLSFISPNGKVEAGKYQIPFEIDIPAFLPGSMDQELDEGRCNIKYGVKAIVKGLGAVWNYQNEVPINLKAKPMDKRPPKPFNASPTTETVNVCCCLSKGEISFGARVNETRLAVGRPCTINVSVRNYSTARVEKLFAEVIQDIECTASGYGGSKSTHKSTALVSVEFPSAIQYARKQGKVDSSHIENELKEIFEEIDSAKHQETLQLNPGALDTYIGSLITVRHTLELQAKTPTCVSNPTLEVPLWIGQPPTFEKPQTEAYTPPAEEGAVQGPAFSITEEEIVVDPITDDPPSFERLSKEMKDTPSHLDLIERKINNEEWSSVWAKMTPGQFGSLIGMVTSGFDQPRVAEALAKEIPSFRCEYVVAALKSGVDFERSAIVEKLVPYCTDLRENQGMIKKQLTEWEQLVTERAFAKALEGK